MADKEFSFSRCWIEFDVTAAAVVLVDVFYLSTVLHFLALHLVWTNFIFSLSVLMPLEKLLLLSNILDWYKKYLNLCITLLSNWFGFWSFFTKNPYPWMHLFPFILIRKEWKTWLTFFKRCSIKYDVPFFSFISRLFNLFLASHLILREKKPKKAVYRTDSAGQKQQKKGWTFMLRNLVSIILFIYIFMLSTHNLLNNTF